MVASIGHYIEGKPVAGDTAARTLEVFNPALGVVTGRLACAGQAEVDRAVAQSLQAFTSWSQTPAPKRAQVLFRFRELLIARKASLARVLGREHGKTLADASGEIQRAIDVVEFACGIPHLMKGAYSSNIGGSIDLYSLREPVGVVVGVTPFNFPCMVPCWMGVMAVACGNSFINKPSEKDPSVPMGLAELWSEAGLPPGVWNVVNGDKETVEWLLKHPDVKAVSFVGSTPAGANIYQTASAHLKRVQAFCGAKNHMVVLPDADMDKAVDALLGAGYGSAGERCMAISVAVPVGETTADELVARLETRVRELKVGPYDDPEADFGPLISAQARDRVLGLVEAGLAEGAHLKVDGRELLPQILAPGHPEYTGGFFVGPCLFDNVKPTMKIYQEEIFGPVLCVVRTQSAQEAIHLLNTNPYGNGAAVFTSSGDAAQSFIRHLDIGMIGINVPIPVPLAFHHFGGAKNSKFGDTPMHGPEAVQFFTKTKTISARWPSTLQAGAEFSIPTPSA